MERIRGISEATELGVYTPVAGRFKAAGKFLAENGAGAQRRRDLAKLSRVARRQSRRRKDVTTANV
jgi:hypothetical protein